MRRSTPPRGPAGGPFDARAAARVSGPPSRATSLVGRGAESAVQKKGNDFATEVDLAIERQVVDALQSATGIGVHGEEFGGAPLDSPLVWVLDPIDGTFNYAAGSPMAAILLGLVRDGEPVAGLTWLPFTDETLSDIVENWEHGDRSGRRWSSSAPLALQELWRMRRALRPDAAAP